MPIISGAGSGGGGSFTLIADSLLAAPAASFDTNTILGGNLPATYKHLRIVLYGRSDRAASVSELVQLRLNNDSTAAHYGYPTVTYSSSTATSGGTNSDSALSIGTIPASTATANYFGTLDALIASYNETTGNKQVQATASWSQTSAATQQLAWLSGGIWFSNVAVSRVTVICGTGANFIAGSHFTLYGLA